MCTVALLNKLPSERGGSSNTYYATLDCTIILDRTMKNYRTRNIQWSATNPTLMENTK